MDSSPQDEISKSAIEAAKKASKVLQKLISKETQLTVAEVQALEKPEETDARTLAERCIQYYRTSQLLISSKIKLYKQGRNKDERDGGFLIMFIDEEDNKKLAKLILDRLATDQERLREGMEESAITEALNIIGNAYINVVAKHYKRIIVSMVPHIIDAMGFDRFIGDLISESEKKTYILFDTSLIVGANIIKVPFLLVVALEKE